MISLRQVLLVAAGGSIGSVLRYLAGSWATSLTGPALFPWGTFFVNVLGSFIIGLVFGYSLRNPGFEINWRLLLATGVCGGFTTFSAFSNESFLLFRQHHFTVACLYIGLTIASGLAATAAGYLVSR